MTVLTASLVIAASLHLFHIDKTLQWKSRMTTVTPAVVLFTVVEIKQ